jgi:DNA-binding NtrC family response regulator
VEDDIVPLFWNRNHVTKATTQLPVDQTRKIARILVIDDEPDSFPLELLQRNGYNVTQWPQVDSASLAELEHGAYDIIVLDIVGIADTSVAANGGLGLLQHIKRVNPSQLVVAYSGQRFSVADQAFFRLADETLAKPTDFVRVTAVLDSLLAEKFNIEHYWNGISSLLESAGASRRAIARVQRKVMGALARGERKDFQPILESVVRDPETAVRVAGVVASLLDLALRFAK